VPEERITTACRPNEEKIIRATLLWLRRALASFTMYGELSAARMSEDFAPVRQRLQQERTFNAGFVSRSAIFQNKKKTQLIRGKACSPYCVPVFSIHYR
jgi:hypothetical protein